MFRRRKLLVATTLLILPLLPIVAALATGAARSAVGVPIAMAQPLVVSRSLVPFPVYATPVISDASVLVLVGSALFALAAIVRRTM